jgi:hypothetical protein
MPDSENDLHSPILWGLGRYTVVIQHTWHQRYTWDIVGPHDQTPFATGSARTVAEALRQATTAAEIPAASGSSRTAPAVRDG